MFGSGLARGKEGGESMMLIPTLLQWLSPGIENRPWLERDTQTPAWGDAEVSFQGMEVGGGSACTPDRQQMSVVSVD